MNEQRNLILASLISMAVLMGFHFLYERPLTSSVPPSASTTLSPSSPSSSPLPFSQSREVSVVSRKEALAQSRRIPVVTPLLKGSVNLQGARLDDMDLVGYRETTDPNSPLISLLSPQTAPASFYVDFGWTSPVGSLPLELPTQETLWTCGQDSLTPDHPLTLTWTNPSGQTFQRTFSVDHQYLISVTDSVTNTGSSPLTLSLYGQVVRGDRPQTGGYFILHEGPIGFVKNKLKELDYTKLLDQKEDKASTEGGWIGMTDKYWLVSLIIPQKTPAETRFLGEKNGKREEYKAQTIFAPHTILPGQTYTLTQHVFVGAKKLDILDGYESRLKFEKFDLAIDFGWFYFLTKPLFYLLTTLNQIFGNFGLAILVMTVFFKGAFFPLATRSYRSMAKMKALAPKIEGLKARHPQDKLRMNQELMELYKKEKINPLSGCLPMMIQAPVFFCLYKVLFVSLEMRHAPFFRWIQDLSAPDPTSLFNLFGLLPWSPPSFLMIGIWPLLMGGTMFLQQKMNPQPADPAQAKALMIMPFFMTFLLASFPAGLVIYWAWSNILSILQQWLISKQEPQKG